MAKKYYVVFIGAEPGIYEDWDTAQVLVSGYPNNKHKAYKTFEEAERAYKLFVSKQ